MSTQMTNDNPSQNSETQKPLTAWRAVEVLLIFVVILLASAEYAPDINESHYLTKAKHFWQPDWCENDLFVSSGDAHWFFFFSLGWLTKFFSLSISAWIMRILCWVLFAIAWQRLSFVLVPKIGAGLLTVCGMVLLIRYCHMAGEWIVGGAEAKSFAYVGVIFALSFLVEKKWTPMWIFLGAASAFHVLVGGWSVIGAVVVIAVGRPNLKELLRQIPALAVGGILALLGVIPALALTIGQNPDEVALANEVYVRSRLPHHLYFFEFESARTTTYLITLIVWVGLASRDRLGVQARRLNVFCVVMFAIGLFGILASIASDAGQSGVNRIANSLLKFYMFRMSDAALAIGLPLLITMSIARWKPNWSRVSTGLVIALVASLLFVDVWHRWSDRRPPADARSLPTLNGQATQDRQWNSEHFENWKKMCEWVKQNTPPDSVFLTPRDQQTFVWYADRAQLACYKDIPQNPADIIEWQRRMDKYYFARPPYWRWSEQDLTRAAAEDGFQYFIERQYSEWHEFRNSELVEMVYPEDRSQKVSYVVFRIKKSDE